MSGPAYSIDLTGDWDKARAMFGGISKGKLKKCLTRALHKEANILAGHVKERIKNGPHAALSKLTIAARRLRGKRGTKPLIASGTLFGAITVWPERGDTLEKFVGVLRQARARNSAGQFSGATKDQAKLVNIGQIQEEGRTFVIKVTPKMRRFFFGVLLPAAGGGGGGGGGKATGGSALWTIRIPARPFLRPTWEEHGGAKSADRIMADIAEQVRAMSKT